MNSGAGGFDSHALPPLPPCAVIRAHPATQHGIDPAELPLAVRAMRLGFRALRLVSRRAAARVALHLFVRPRRHPVPAREREVLARGERSDVRVGERRIAAWTWQPSGGPTRGTAYLVHGWEGRGGQLSAFADPLVAEGFRVVAFDHVGHGESDGVRCSLPTMRDTLAAVVEATLGEGEDAPAAVVAHSMGSFAATLLFARGWRATRVAYLAPPDDLLVYFSRYLELATGSADLLPDLIDLLERRYGERVGDFEFHGLVERLGQPLLVLHSTDDRDVPIEGGRFVASHWPGARIVELEGLGHRRILRSSEAVRRAVEFLAE